MSTVLLAGRWDDGTTSQALTRLGEGIVRRHPGTVLDILPFGGGATFEEALAGLSTLVRVPVDASSTYAAGESARRAMEAGERTILVEGGHHATNDCGMGFLEALTSSSGLPLDALLDEAEATVGRWGGDLVCAASTARPLLGFSSVLAVAPDLEPITAQNTDLTALLTDALSTRPKGRVQLGHFPASHPGRMNGSGAGGGVGAIIAAIGGRIVSTGDVLMHYGPVRAAMKDADLVIVLEPELVSPLLAESTLDFITQEAGHHALPVVAVGRSSTLSSHERAQWGLHGVMTMQDLSLEEVGERIARTWLR